MSSDVVSGYADGLVAIARAEGNTETISRELFAVAEAVDGNDELHATLTDAGLAPSRRQQIVEDLLGPMATSTTTALVSMLVGAGRARQLSDIARAVGTKVAAEDNKQLAEVRSAVPLTEDQIARLRTALASSIGSEVEIRVIVDPSVVGGIVTQIGDTVIDGSVRQKLTKMRESFS
jgi:F-type H+-transporting ATPase subunit delta